MSIAYVRASPVMFPNINPVKKLRFERSEDFVSSPATDNAGSPAAASIATILRAFGSSIDDDLPRPSMSVSTSDWSSVIDRIRTTASRVREVEAQARERETHVEEIMDRVRADMLLAEERARAAELQASRIEANAAERIRAAEERASLAEERARVSEEWLKRIHETIFSEFAHIDEDRT